MQEKRGIVAEFDTKTGFIKWFSELNRNSGNYAGGKGANLAEIYNLKVPVPPGFVVTAQAYSYFIEKNNLQEIIEAYNNLDSGNEKKSAHDMIEGKSEGAIVAVRSSSTAEDLEEASFAG